MYLHCVVSYLTYTHPRIQTRTQCRRRVHLNRILRDRGASSRAELACDNGGVSRKTAAAACKKRKHVVIYLIAAVVGSDHIVPAIPPPCTVFLLRDVGEN